MGASPWIPQLLGIQADLSSLQFLTRNGPWTCLVTCQGNTPSQRAANEGIEARPVVSMGINCEGPSQLPLRICWGLSCNCLVGQVLPTPTLLTPLSCISWEPSPLKFLPRFSPLKFLPRFSVSREPNLRKEMNQSTEWFAPAIRRGENRELATHV